MSRRPDDDPAPARLDQLLSYRGPVVNVARAPLAQAQPDVQTEVLPLLAGMMGTLGGHARNVVVDNGRSKAARDMERYNSPMWNKEDAAKYEGGVIAGYRDMQEEHTPWSRYMGNIRGRNELLRDQIPVKLDEPLLDGALGEDGGPRTVTTEHGRQYMVKKSMEAGGRPITGVYTGHVDMFGRAHGSGVLKVPQTELDIANMMDPLRLAELRLSTISAEDQAKKETIPLRKEIEDAAAIPNVDYMHAWESVTAHDEKKGPRRDGSWGYKLRDFQDWAMNAPDAPMYFRAFGGHKDMDRRKFAVWQLVDFLRSIPSTSKPLDRDEIFYEDYEKAIATLRAGRSKVTSRRTDVTTPKYEPWAVPTTREIKGWFHEGAFHSGHIIEEGLMDDQPSSGHRLKKTVDYQIDKNKLGGDIKEIRYTVKDLDAERWSANPTRQYIKIGTDRFEPDGTHTFHGPTMIGLRKQQHYFEWQGDTEQVKCRRECTVEIKADDGLDPSDVKISGLGQVRFYDTTTNTYIWVRGTIRQGTLYGRAMADKDFHGYGKDLFFTDDGFVRAADQWNDPGQPDETFETEPPPGQSYLGDDDYSFASIGTRDAPWGTTIFAAVIWGIAAWSLRWYDKNRKLFQ